MGSHEVLTAGTNRTAPSQFQGESPQSWVVASRVRRSGVEHRRILRRSRKSPGQSTVVGEGLHYPHKGLRPLTQSHQCDSEHRFPFLDASCRSPLKRHDVTTFNTATHSFYPRRESSGILCGGSAFRDAERVYQVDEILCLERFEEIAVGAAFIHFAGGPIQRLRCDHIDTEPGKIGV